MTVGPDADQALVKGFSVLPGFPEKAGPNLDAPRGPTDNAANVGRACLIFDHGARALFLTAHLEASS